VRVALYARTSTPEQNPRAQLENLRHYAEARGLELVEEYVDEGISGSKKRRPALDRLLRDALLRRFDAVAVTKVDRLGRSLHHLLTILGDFEALGVNFIALDDGVDTSTPTGRLLMQMRGAFAEYELAMIRERTRAGMASARRRGARLGRPKVIRGPDCFTVERLLGKGASQASIARELGVSAATVSREVARLKASKKEKKRSSVHMETP